MTNNFVSVTPPGEKKGVEESLDGVEENMQTRKPFIIFITVYTFYNSVHPL